MIEIFDPSLVDKLIILEKAGGNGISHHITPPITSALNDILSIQAVARRLAASIGLSQFVFVITFVKQEENVGGHIDLSTRDEMVYIEIDSDALAFPQAIAATLCHEICHKWLQVKRVWLPDLMENEILTDITAVFLGFGKIMLNGCEVINQREEATSSGIKTITTTRNTGYLKRDQLALVYRMVCAMRNIPRSDYIGDLVADAAAAVKSCDRLLGLYFDPRLHEMEHLMEAAEEARLARGSQERQLSELHKHLVYVKKSFVDTIENFITDGHNHTAALDKRFETLTANQEVNPAMRFLQAAKKRHEIEKIVTELTQSRARLNALLSHAKTIGRHLWENGQEFPPPNSTMFNIVCCPKDGTKLRLPLNSSDIVVACPTCRYRFSYNTSSISFKFSHEGKKQSPASIIRKLWSKLSSRVRRGKMQRAKH